MLVKWVRKFKLAAAAVAASVMMSGPALSEEVLKLSFFASPKDPTYADVLLPWVDAINAEGKGIVRIETFRVVRLYADRAGAEAKAVTDGVVDMAWVVLAYTPGRFPDNDVMELPGLFVMSANPRLPSVVFMTRAASRL